MRLPKGLTVDMIIEAVQDSNSGIDNPGFCLSCGERQEGCEPDAERYECESCGSRTVYGAEQCLIMFGGLP